VAVHQFRCTGEDGSVVRILIIERGGLISDVAVATPIIYISVDCDDMQLTLCGKFRCKTIRVGDDVINGIIDFIARLLNDPVICECSYTEW